MYFVEYTDTDSMLMVKKRICHNCNDNVNRVNAQAVYPPTVYRDEDWSLVTAYFQDLLDSTNRYHSEQQNQIDSVAEFVEKLFVNDRWTGFKDWYLSKGKWSGSYLTKGSRWSAMHAPINCGWCDPCKSICMKRGDRPLREVQGIYLNNVKSSSSLQNAEKMLEGLAGLDLEL